MKNATPFRRSAKRTDQHQPRPQRYRPLSLAVALAFTGAGMALLAGQARSQALPTGGQVSAGAATVSRPTATSMLVNQTTDKVSINWQSFNIGSGNSVHFQQPSYNSIALNRVLGNSRSEIFGNLTSTGQVFLVNPNGVLFGAGAQVDVGGLVASTLNITDRNFLDGKYVFGDTANATGGNGSVINQGTLNAKNGGYLALIGNQAVNTGSMHAHLGSVVMGAGGKAQLTLAGSKLIKFEVTEGALDALAENGGLIRANGGQVILTAGARDSLLKSTVNNSGIIEAQTVERQPGNILLLAGMEAGTTNVGGKLDASAPASLNPNGGPEGNNGGFIETSGAYVKVADSARVTTLAANGNGRAGTWLIDPKDYTIAATGGDMTGAAVGTALAGGNFSILSSGGGAVGGTAGNGDIHVNDSVNWSANTLTLTAARDININAVMTASGTSALTMNTGTANGADAAVAGGLVRTGFNPGGGFKGRVDFGARSGTGFLTINGNGYTVINSLGAEGSTTAADLQGMQGNLTGYYALGTDIDATPTATWNYFSALGNTPAHYRGFTPVGSTFNSYLTMFRGSFNGLGHVITNLTVDRRYVGGAAGLFGAVLGGTPANPIFSGYARAGTLANVGLVGGAIRSHSSVGGLVGQATGATINNSFASNNVLGAVYTNAYGVVDAVVANNDYGGGDYVGGLVGHIEHQNYGSLSDRSTLISQSYATGNVAGGDSVGGLVGMNHGGTVINSHASGNVTGRDYAGGLVGLSRASDYWLLSRSNAAVINSYATGNVQGRDFTGGLAGLNGGSGNTASVGGQVINSYATGNVTGNNFVGGLVGMNGNGGAALISGSYASGDVTGNLYVGGLAGFNSSITSAPLYILYLGVINNSHASGNVRGYNFVGGLVGALDDAFGTWGDASWSGIISSSYATGRVTGTSGSPPTFDGDKLIVYGAGASPTPFVGGLVGGTSLASYSTGLDSRTNADICANCFFNSQTSGQHPGIRGIVGGLNVGYDVEWDMLGTGRTTAQLQGSLPGGYTSLVTALPMPGFDPAIWGTGPGLYPYLKALNPNGVQAISGFATNGSGGALDGGRVAGLVNGQGVGNASVGANGYYYLATPGGTLGAGANVLTYTDGSGSAAAGAAINKVTGTVSAVGGMDVSPGVLSETTTAALYSSTATSNPANLTAAIGGNSSVAALVAPMGRGISSSAAQFDIDVPLNLAGNLQIKTSALDADINVNSAVNWSSGTLSLMAARDVNLNAVMSADGSAALVLNTAGNSGSGNVKAGFNPDGTFKGRVDFGARSGTGFLTINGNGYTVINSLGAEGSTSAADLQGMNGNLAGYYALGDNIDASSTSAWNAGGGFAPVGGGGLFSGSFDGLGHTITNLTINRPTANFQGLFGTVYTAGIRNAGLAGGAVSGASYVGGLAGGAYSSSISNSYASGAITGSGDQIGGLVGNLYSSSINNSHASGAVSGNLSISAKVGGLVGESYDGSISNSYASGAVGSWSYTGGLVGYSSTGGSISNSYASGAVNGNYTAGGLVGWVYGSSSLSNSYASGAVSGTTFVGGLVGYTQGNISNSYASGAVSGTTFVGGLVGYTQGNISNSYASGAVSGASDVGGLAGGAYSSSISNSYWDTQTSGQSSSGGGTGLTSAQMMQAGSFTTAGWNIANAGGSNAVWRIYEGSTAPLLRSFLTPLTLTGTTLTYNGAVQTAPAVAIANVSGSSVGARNAGVYASSYTSNQQGYDLSGGDLTITAANLVLSSSDVSKTYNGLLNAAGVLTAAGGTQLFGTDTASGGSFAFTDKNAGAGNKTVTVSGATLNDGNSGGNYVVSYVDNTTSTITPKTLGYSTSAANKVYDGNTTASVTLSALTGLVGSETVSASGTATFNSKDVATANLVTVSSAALADGSGGGLASNYQIAAGGTAAAGITAKSLAYSASAANKVYDGNVVAAATLGGLSGLIGTETVFGGSVAASFNSKDVGTANLVTVNGATLLDGANGGVAGNYQIVAGGTAAAGITQRALTVGGITASNKVYDQTTAATVNAAGASYTGLIGGDAVTVSATGVFSDKNVANGKTVTLTSGYTGADVGNYAITNQASTSADITPKALTVGGITASTKVYDQTTAATVNAAGASYTGLIGGDAVTVSATGVFSDKNVATGKTVTLTSGYTGADLGNYALTNQASTTADITPRALIISAAGVNRTYDALTNASVNLSDTRISGDVLSTGYGAASFADKNVANGKAVSVSGITLGSTDAGNYSFNTTASTTANITPAPLTVSGIIAVNKVYDQTTAAAVNTAGANYGGLFGGDVVTVSATGVFSDKNVANGKTVTLTSGYTGADVGNYAITNQASTTADITPKALTVGGITASNKVYDQTTSATVSVAGASYTGLIGGDAVTVSATGLFSDKNVANGKTVTLSSGYSGADVGNYTITNQASTTADITPKALTVGGITASNKVYDQTTAATVSVAGASYSGLIGGDAVTVSATGVFSDKNAATGKTVTLASGYTGADVGNYAITNQASTTADITPKALTVAGLTASNKVYDQTTAATVSVASASYTGLIGGDAVTVSATGAFSDKNAATGKTVTLTNGYSGADVGNYAITNQASTTADITPKALTVSGLTASNKVYDQTTSATVSVAGASYTGLIGGDAVTVSATGVFSDKNVANGKTVTLTNGYTGADVGNYAITGQASATADITPKTLTVGGITASNKVYDQTTAATVSVAGASYSGLIGGDAVTVSATGVFSDKNAATGKTVTLSSGYTGADVGNYAITNQASIIADITPKALTVAGITASNKVYDQTTVSSLSVAGANLTGLIGGDAVTVSATGAFSDKNVATGKTVTLTSGYTGADVSNYAITNQASTTADITPRALTISATGVNRIYDASTGATVNLSDNRISGDVLSTGYGGASFADKNVANGKAVSVTGITLGSTDAGNYSFNTSASATADITPKALTVGGVTASNKVYDQTTAATVSVTGASYTGLIGGDVVAVNATGVFSDKNAATGKTVTLNSGYTGADVSNYTITNQASTTADITPKGLTVGGITASNKVYDQTTAAAVNVAGASYSGLIGGDAVAVSATGVFSDKNVATGKPVTLTSGYTGADVSNYTITNQASTTADITPKALTVGGITAGNKVYDQTTAATVSVTGASYTGLIGGDAVAVNATGVFSDKNVATGKTVTLTSGYTGADVSNYTITHQASTTADITPKALTVGGITAGNKVYDQTTAATVTVAGASYAGLIGGDAVAVNATGAFSDKNAATGKTVTLNSGYTGADVGNYTITDLASTTADITPKGLTVGGITASNKVYDQTTAATVSVTGASYTGLIGGDAVAVNATGVFSDKNAATGKTVTLTYSGADVGNYAITHPASTTADITPKAATVTASNAAKTYGSTLSFAGTEFASSGLIAGETIGSVNLTSTGAASAAIVAGSPYAITANNAAGGAGSSFIASNYNLSYVNGSLTVNPAPLTITANGLSKVIDNTPYTGGNGVIYTGLVNGESINVLGGALAWGGNAQGAVNVGNYAIAPSGLTASNYSISYVNGALVISTAGLPPGAQDAINAAQQGGGGTGGTGGGGGSGNSTSSTGLFTIVGVGMNVPEGVQ